MKEMKKYLEERITKLEDEQNMWLDQMTSSYEEKGYNREMYLLALEKKIELQDALMKLYQIEQGE